MKISTDSLFVKGDSHSVCEDYSLTSNKSVILADGCSSAEDSDFGARILAQCLWKSYIKGEFNSWASVLEEANKIADLLDLPSSSLYATLIGSYIDLAGKHIVVNMAGDGVIAARRRSDGVLKIIRIKFITNAPFYLQYQYKVGDVKTYLDQLGDQICEEVYEGDNEVVNNTYSYLEGTENRNGIMHYSFPIADYDLVLISTDGIESFYRRGASRSIIVGLDYKEVLRDLMQFKGFSGEFLHRRFKRFIETYEKQNIYHYDDVGLGVIYIENPSEGEGVANT